MWIFVILFHAENEIYQPRTVPKLTSGDMTTTKHYSPVASNANCTKSLLSLFAAELWWMASLKPIVNFTSNRKIGSYFIARCWLTGSGNTIDMNPTTLIFRGLICGRTNIGCVFSIIHGSSEDVPIFICNLWETRFHP